MIYAILVLVTIDLFIHIAQDARINSIEDLLRYLSRKSDNGKDDNKTND